MACEYGFEKVGEEDGAEVWEHNCPTCPHGLIAGGQFVVRPELSGEGRARQAEVKWQAIHNLRCEDHHPFAKVVA